MRRDPFEQLRKMVHISDPENENPMDSLRKLRFFLEYLIARYKENYIPEEHLAIDACLSLRKGRLSFLFQQSENDSALKYLCFVKAKPVIY